MTTADDEFLRTLRATFKVEAAEHLEAIGSGLLALEKSTDPAERQSLVETVFRAAHSLKGASRAVDFNEIEGVCQSLETLFASWKRGESEPTQEALDQAHRAVDRMAAAVALPTAATMEPRGEPRTAATASQSAASPSAATGSQASPPAAVTGSQGLTPRAATAGPAAAKNTGRAAKPAPPPAGAPPAPAPAAAASEVDTVRVSVSALDARLLEAEELLSAKLVAGQRASDLATLAVQFEQWRSQWSKVQPQARALRRTAEHAGLAEFFDWNSEYIRTLEGKVSTLRRSAEQDRLTVEKLVDDLLENSKKLLMLPLATLAPLLTKVVRDIARDQGKEADFTMRGGDVKIDKRILEEMKDPLVHLLRNCVDHGIEPPQVRQRAGKQPRATIALTVSQANGNQVELAVSDDGGGIDVDRVKSAATQRGLISADSARTLSDASAEALVFEADVSTSPIITQLSGRGLGLAIVREKTERLGGRVSVESQRGAGTTFRMVLPLTLATFRGVLVEASQRRFVVPTSQVERVMRFKPAEVRTVEGRNTLSVNDRTVALADLAEVLQLPEVRRPADAPAATPALIIGTGDQRMAFAVDAVLDEREVLVKRLAKPLSRVRNIAGATVLASGEVAPILNVPDLLKSARRAGGTLRSQAPVVKATAPARRVLVAEDSITSRMLIKGILESAGYQVKTAVDGMDAFTALRAESFDLVVSDVEMPRLNGFDLTARIRADRALAELPVVLVTALESREDRERGIDVGANAYIVKSSLDQSDLLDALRRLL